jgi:hypothetical protein
MKTLDYLKSQMGDTAPKQESSLNHALSMFEDSQRALAESLEKLEQALSRVLLPATPSQAEKLAGKEAGEQSPLGNQILEYALTNESLDLRVKGLLRRLSI